MGGRGLKYHWNKFAQLHRYRIHRSTAVLSVCMVSIIFFITNVGFDIGLFTRLVYTEK